MESEAAKVAKVAAQWPKLHRCKAYGGGVVQITPEQWKSWPLYAGQADSYADYEHKHCGFGCGSTLTVIVKIHDLGAE